MKVYPVFYNSMKQCMFCQKLTSEIYELPLSYFYGYKYCKDCNFMADKNMVEWIQQNKKISWLFLCKLINKKINITDDTFNVQRSNGNIDNDWFLNINGWITFNETCNDYLLPIIKYDMDKRILFKNIELKLFCKLNNGFDYKLLQHKIKHWI